MKILIRASYPNYAMVRRYALDGPEAFNCDVDDVNNTLEGNKPGTVIYVPDGETAAREFPPRWYDMYYLLRSQQSETEAYFRLLLAEHGGTATPAQSSRLRALRSDFRKELETYVSAHPLPENEELITAVSPQRLTEDQISHKGRMLVELTNNCYPVPDFVILTAKLFCHPEHLEERLNQALDYLEVMTNRKLGDAANPLVFAIRCAMPQYIPGLMPTQLNIGVTRVVYNALRTSHGDTMANRVYLSTLHTVCEMLGVERKYDTTDISLTQERQLARIGAMELEIRNAGNDGERILTDSRYQALRLVRYVYNFFAEHQDLILTFMQGKQAYPSLILQRMVWTIGNDQSYPGVLYSRHSRSGKGRQIESCSNIFGEEIMTGDAVTKDTAYTSRDEIKEGFPAVYHFDPLLGLLERRYKSPVTIEFAVETLPRRVSLFSVLQLNLSEMTGRAALISSIDLLTEKRIVPKDVTDIIKPYHLRQIVSASIDDKSMQRLQFFGSGLSVLPRTAVSAVLCFSSAKAREVSADGTKVCLCQERFVPEDTITLNVVDAILSMTPAAIHVVTACRGYGIPAFMDLAANGIRFGTDEAGYYLANPEGLVLREGDMVTVSSHHQTIYKGEADYRPARFSKYLNGEPVELSEEEKVFFEEMRIAYLRYQEIVTSNRASLIDNLDKLARFIRLDLHDKPDTARAIVNNWFVENTDLYVQQVLESNMGSHQDQSRVFALLSDSYKVGFFQNVASKCLAEGRSGLTAGSFMLGRFVAKSLPIRVWNGLSDRVVAFLLNEYVLYEKYLHVLEEVGEIRLARAHSRIQTEGIDNMFIANFDYMVFVPLLCSLHDWGNIVHELELMEHQDNTHLLVEKLSLPIDQIFDLSKPWIKAQVEACKK